MDVSVVPHATPTGTRWFLKATWGDRLFVRTYTSAEFGSVVDEIDDLMADGYLTDWQGEQLVCAVVGTSPLMGGLD